MARIKRIFGSNPIYLTAGILAISALVLLAVIAGARATDQSSFCANCHEMQPYHTAWSEGPHAGVACVECHVDDDDTARLLHKMEALNEVWSHVAGEPTFPLAQGPDIPDERCLRCHADVDVDLEGFAHADHAAKGPCVDCHADAGHRVTAEALAEAGILDPSSFAAREARVIATVGKGAADLPGHVATTCDSCHALAENGCETCHEPKHEARGACSTCHAPGTEWVFSHPVKADCFSCHSPLPKTHPTTTPTQTCATCHKGSATIAPHDERGTCAECHSGDSGGFTTVANAPHEPRGVCAKCHGASGVAGGIAKAPAIKVGAKAPHGDRGRCSNCHTITGGGEGGGATAPSIPAGAKAPHEDRGPCANCHADGSPTDPGTPFVHPTSTACSQCHNPPGGHYSTPACATCHTTPGSSWSFSHPGSGATCTTCHGAPSGHSGGACTSCHTTASWTFVHPASTSCASCHSAPANHLGTNCAACHTPTRAWSDSTWTHPGTGEEHTWRSFACTSCHPVSYSSADCTSCHEAEGGEDDEDDDEDDD